jgi:hypothetical protein
MPSKTRCRITCETRAQPTSSGAMYICKMHMFESPFQLSFIRCFYLPHVRPGWPCILTSGLTITTRSPCSLMGPRPPKSPAFTSYLLRAALMQYSNIVLKSRLRCRTLQLIRTLHLLPWQGRLVPSTLFFVLSPELVLHARRKEFNKGKFKKERGHMLVWHDSIPSKPEEGFSGSRFGRSRGTRRPFAKRKADFCPLQIVSRILGNPSRNEMVRP